jgi:hypothetical protein
VVEKVMDLLLFQDFLLCVELRIHQVSLMKPL